MARRSDSLADRWRVCRDHARFAAHQDREPLAEGELEALERAQVRQPDPGPASCVVGVYEPSARRPRLCVCPPPNHYGDLREASEVVSNYPDRLREASEVVSNYPDRLREASEVVRNYRVGLREAPRSGSKLPGWPSRSPSKWFETTELAFAKLPEVVRTTRIAFAKPPEVVWNYRLGLREGLRGGSSDSIALREAPAGGSAPRRPIGQSTSPCTASRIAITST